MGVNLGGREVAVSQKFFDGVDIGTVVEHVGGKGVAEDMGACTVGSGARAHVAFDDLVDFVVGDRFAFGSYEQRRGGIGRSVGFLLSEDIFSQGDITGDGLRQFVFDGDNTFFVAFAAYFNGEGSEVDGGKREGSQFGAAHAGFVEHTESEAFGLPVEGIGKNVGVDAFHFFLFEKDGEAYWAFGRIDGSHDVAFHALVLHEIFEPCTKGGELLGNGAGVVAGVELAHLPAGDFAGRDVVGIGDVKREEVLRECLNLAHVVFCGTSGQPALMSDIVGETLYGFGYFHVCKDTQKKRINS